MFFILEILKKPVQTTRITQQQKIIISRLKKRQQHKKQQYFINKIIKILQVNIISLDIEYSIKYVVVFWLRVRLQHLKAVHTRCNAVSVTGDSTGYCTINCAV